MKNIEIQSIIKMSIKKISSFWNNLSSKDSIPLELLIAGEFGPFRTKISHTQKINIDTKLLLNKISENALSSNSISISNLRLSKVGIQKFKWKFDINAKNIQPFDLTIKMINVKVFPD